MQDMRKYVIVDIVDEFIVMHCVRTCIHLWFDEIM